MDLLRQRLCKRGNYATVEESGVFHAVSVAHYRHYAALKQTRPPLLCDSCKHLYDAGVGMGHMAA
jgi:TPP-dependent indolepyruvate ferredoxin oxidoreductase alpha subunit